MDTDVNINFHKVINTVLTALKCRTEPDTQSLLLHFRSARHSKTDCGANYKEVKLERHLCQHIFYHRPSFSLIILSAHFLSF